MENEKLFEFMEKMYFEMQNGFRQVNEKFEKLESKVNDIESKVDKNTILLEKAQSNIKTLAEIQQSFSEQLDRTKNKDGKTLGERLNIIELAVTNTSKTLDNEYNKLNEKLDDLQIDINALTAKTVKTDTKVIQFERLLTNSDKKQG